MQFTWITVGARVMEHLRDNALGILREDAVVTNADGTFNIPVTRAALEKLTELKKPGMTYDDVFDLLFAAKGRADGEHRWNN